MTSALPLRDALTPPSDDTSLPRAVGHHRGRRLGKHGRVPPGILSRVSAPPSLARRRTVRPVGLALSAAVLAGVVHGAVSLVDSLVRADPPEIFSIPSTIGASAAFTGALCAQSLRVRSSGLARVAALTAIVLFVLVPAVSVSLRSSGASQSVDAVAVATMLMFTYSTRGWVAVGAAIVFVLVLRRSRTLDDR